MVSFSETALSRKKRIFDPLARYLNRSLHLRENAGLSTAGKYTALLGLKSAWRGAYRNPLLSLVVLNGVVAYAAPHYLPATAVGSAGLYILGKKTLKENKDNQS